MKKIKSTIIFLLCYLVFQSCTPVEGCKDPLASNFDPEADKNCCCQYYQLKFEIDHNVDSLGTDFNLLSAYPDADLNFYQVKSSAILISSISLINRSGESFSVIDKIELPLSSGGSELFTNDFNVIKPGTFINSIGGFSSFGDFERLRFLVGLNNSASRANALEIYDNTNPLSYLNSNAFFDANSNTFNYGKWEIINTNTSDTSFYKIADTVWIELPINVVAKDGLDTRIPLRLNYSILFEGISFTNDNQVLIEQKIKNNLRNAFSIQ